ncbi:hypothetical protein NL676_001437 [Syzygium grande]|nr:hypothetical protein NL676_001437 [Syzygium grande]
MSPPLVWAEVGSRAATRLEELRMKASLKFREDQKPLIRTKVPLGILGLPSDSASSPASRELALHLDTSLTPPPLLPRR